MFFRLLLIFMPENYPSSAYVAVVFVISYKRLIFRK
jgi:hypothetical protein